MIVAYRGRSYLYTEDIYYLYLLHDVEREHRHCSVLDNKRLLLAIKN
jgi:hypothetical protein